MLTPLDYIVLLVYIVGVVWFGLRSAGSQKNTTDYFLGGRNLPWWAVCFSIVATETSTLTIIGIPAVAYGGTMIFLQLTLGYLAGRIAVSIIFLPRYLSGELVTAYAFLGRRFGARMQGLSAATFMVTRLLADGVRLFATAIPLKMIADSAGLSIGYPVIIVFIGFLTIIYTYYGGLKAVVWMDVVQMSLYLVAAAGSIIVLVMSIDAADWQSVRSAGKLTVLEWGSGGISGMLTQPYAFITAVVGGGIFSMASHGTDHLIVQRLLACRSLGESRKALIGSAFLVMIQFAVFLLVGVLLWAYYGGATMTELGLSRGDEVFPRFIIEGLPSGISGLVLAGILAAAMSTLSSSLNALASSSVMDLLPLLKNWKSDETSKLRISRLLTLVWGLVFMFFATLFEDQQNPVVELGLSIASFTYGALLGAFLLGIINVKVRESGAIIAFAVSIVVMVLIIFGVWYSPDSGWTYIFRPSDARILADGLRAIAWPWYTCIGTAITLIVGSLTVFMHR